MDSAPLGLQSANENVNGNAEPLSPPTTKTSFTDDSQAALDPRPILRATDSLSVDAGALNNALNDLEDTRVRPREYSPGASPIRKRQRMVYGDRFIPNRDGQDLVAGYQLLHDDGSPATPAKNRKRTPHNDLLFQRTEEQNQMFSTLLRSELFDDTIPTNLPQSAFNPSFSPYTNGDIRTRTPPSTNSSIPARTLSPATPRKNLFTYSSPTHHSLVSPARTPSNRRFADLNPNSPIYSLSPVKQSTQNVLLSPRKQPRYVNKIPFKVLDAPELADDFYLNLVDWGASNILGVGLGQCVYMWNSASGKVDKLCDLGDDSVTSVNWIQRGAHVAIGTSKGYVQIWDAERRKRLRVMPGHSARAGALAWNEHILSSGSRDRTILHRDVRQAAPWFKKLQGHKQEVCGLKWNIEDGQLASGGNDNKLLVWDRLANEPLHKFTEHKAAVKAIAWSPHQRGILASGGGTADRTIRFHNTLTGAKLQELDTGSQVCNLSWSKNSNEIVSTHGFSQNQVVIWKYPSMQQVASLTGHTYRVLYLAMSPDGQTIVTGAGDETLRFWNCFKKKASAGHGLGKLDDWGMIR